MIQCIDFYIRLVARPWLQCLRPFLETVANAGDLPCEVLFSL